MAGVVHNRLAGVVHKVAGGTGYFQEYWFFNSSAFAQVICTVFIFHWCYKILTTDINIK